jgi:hypothetical protein
MPIPQTLPVKHNIFPNFSKKQRNKMHYRKLETKRRLFEEHQATLKK